MQQKKASLPSLVKCSYNVYKLLVYKASRTRIQLPWASITYFNFKRAYYVNYCSKKKII